MSELIRDLSDEDLKQLAAEHGVDRRYARDKIVDTLTEKLGENAPEAPAPSEDAEVEDDIPVDVPIAAVIDEDGVAQPIDLSEPERAESEDPAEDKNSSNQSGGTLDEPEVEQIVDEVLDTVQEDVEAAVAEVDGDVESIEVEVEIDPSDISPPVEDQVETEDGADKNSSNQSGGTWGGYPNQPYVGTRIGADGKRRPV